MSQRQSVCVQSAFLTHLRGVRAACGVRRAACSVRRAACRRDSESVIG